jgi:SMODS and SLOG-associating 2TM effector domain 1
VTADDGRLLELYRRCRVADQLMYYDDRGGEFDAAVSQLGILSAIVLALGSTAAALAGAAVEGTPVWAVLAAVFPAIATALAAFGSLYAYEQQAKIYADAAKALRRLDRTLPDLAAEQDSAAAVHQFITTAEDVFRREQGQWGQLVSELNPPRDGS